VIINPILQKSMPYDVFKDIVPLSITSSSPEVLVVAPQLGIKTYAELVAYGKANPGKLNYASAGVGTTPHLAAELWKSRTGIDAVHVPYKGIGASYTDMMSNKVQMSFSSIAGARPFTDDGRVIALATTGSVRSPVYPNLPTVAEAGLPGYAAELHYGLVAPAGTPPEVIAKLNAALNNALADADIRQRLAADGTEVLPGTPSAYAADIASEEAKWGAIIKQTGVNAQ
jgi:tripartite-type tricarboxylate transporter receptor subunit TctC